jgi:single-strand DNA-binding protein
MASFSQSIVLGNLGADVELKMTEKHGPVAKFSICHTAFWKDKTSGATKQREEWHKVECWGELANLCASHLSKGDMALVVGESRDNSYDDKDGVKVRSKRIHAHNVTFLTPSEFKQLKITLLIGQAYGWDFNKIHAKYTEMEAGHKAKAAAKKAANVKTAPVVTAPTGAQAPMMVQAPSTPATLPANTFGLPTQVAVAPQAQAPAPPPPGYEYVIINGLPYMQPIQSAGKASF